MRLSLLSRSFTTRIVIGGDVRKRALQGAQTLSKAVQLTLGPGGRNVIIDPFDPLKFTALSAYP